MKIALCISGKFRNSIFCFPTLYNNFILNKKTDVFIHSWDNVEECFELYNPKKIIIESQKEVLDKELSKIRITDDVKVNPSSNISNNVLMFYGIKKVIELVDDSYDVVIRIRPDLYLNKLPMVKILNQLNNNQYDLQIPNPLQNHTGINDQIAIGITQKMKVYSSVFDNLNNILNETKYWHPESILNFFLKKNNININQINYQYGIVRDVNVIFAGHSNINYKKI